MNRRFRITISCGAVFCFPVLAISANAELLLRAGYTSFQDSPLNGLHFNHDAFFFEDFEDGLNTPNVYISAGGVLDPSQLTDSVDADDGNIDGFGRDGHSWSSMGNRTIRITFDGGDVGLPTHVGLVWTDGGAEEVRNGLFGFTMSFFDKEGQFMQGLGTSLGDGRDDGTTADDYFIGAYEGGRRIQAIEIKADPATDYEFEIDHLQFGVAPEPNAALMLAAALLTARLRFRVV